MTTDSETAVNDESESYKSGFVSFVGRPNAGKSTLLNAICGAKLAITSNKPQTTRNQIQGVLHRENSQIVFVDTPGIHKPKSALGTRLNETATATVGDADVVCLVVDATAEYGRGDEFVANKLSKDSVVVLNKIDAASKEQIFSQLNTLGELGFAAYFPVSARTSRGLDALVEHLFDRMPKGPRYYPPDMVTDVTEPVHIAELVREQLFRLTRQELPYSIATRVVEWRWPYIKCEILVARESQKGMVIGKGGSLLKQVGTAVRDQLQQEVFLELTVAVDADWQRRPERIIDLGY